jgi:predicted kinase
MLYVMVGAGFAGKSTLAKAISDALDIALVSQDAHYFELREKEPNWGEALYEREGFKEMIRDRIRVALAAGRSVVFDNTNLTRQERNELRGLAEAAGAKAVVVFLDTPETVLDERQARNTVTKERHDVAQHYLDDAKRKLEPPAADEHAYRFTPGMDAAAFIATLPR